MTATHYRSKHWIKQGVFDDLASFRDLEDRIDAIEGPKDRGDIFEIFIEAYLETQPIHQCVDHWVVGDVPLTICEDLNLPNDGTGIDGVYQDRLGNHIPYQVKYLRADQLPYKTISTFYGVVDPALDQVLFTNAKRLSPRTPERDGVRLHLADQFHALSFDQLRDMEAWLKRKPVRRERATPDPVFQVEVLSDIKATLNSNDRQYLPKRTDLAVHSQASLNKIARQLDAAGIDPTAGRRQTGQGRDNIVPYLFS
jgi:hypothetical protein